MKGDRCRRLVVASWLIGPVPEIITYVGPLKQAFVALRKRSGLLSFVDGGSASSVACPLAFHRLNFTS